MTECIAFCLMVCCNGVNVMQVEKLIELHELARKEAVNYPLRRFLYSDISQMEGRHFTGIVGPRGSGKTVMLRQYALEHQDAFYLAADTLEAGDDAWDIIQTLQEHYSYRTFLLDEIHFLPDAASLLKRLYDFRKLRVLFSSSVALAMHASAYDLSRRVRMATLFPFSYREYVFFKEGMSLKPLTVDAVAGGQWDPDHVRAGRFFNGYLRGGLLPFSLEEPDPLPLLRNTIEKVIARDIPSVMRLAVDELETIRRLLRFIGSSGVDGINYSSLSRNLGITKYKAEQYAGCLEKAFVLHRLFPAGTNVVREPKVLMAPPCRLLYRAYEEAAGGLREDFFVEAVKQAGLPVRYLKSRRGAKTPDFLVGEEGSEVVAEVGGKGKGRSQFKGIEDFRKVIFADTPVPDEKRVPLFMAGYLAP
ncbi:MAG: AAA family ATPase [Kiritimatiellia bacterium]